MYFVRPADESATTFEVVERIEWSGHNRVARAHLSEAHAERLAGAWNFENRQERMRSAMPVNFGRASRPLRMVA